MKPQWYLIHSPNVPQNLFLFTEDLETGKDFRGQLQEDFGQTLVPLGTNLPKSQMSVPKDTLFAGVIWGDGEHFEEYVANTWGVLGDIQRLSSFHGVLHRIDGEESEVNFDGEEGVSHIMPPEAFGLESSKWWEDAFAWCES